MAIEDWDMGDSRDAEDVNMKDCLICKWINEKESAIQYNEKIVIIIPELSYEKYHILICPKKHYESIFEMPEKEYEELFSVMRRMGEIIETKLGADATRYMLNNNHLNVSESKMHIKHVHIQAFPCFGKLTDVSGKFRKKLSRKEIRDEKEEILKHVKGKE